MKYKPYPAYIASGVEWLGEIPAHWEVKRLKFVAHIEAGQSPSSEVVVNGWEGLPFLQGNAEFGSLNPVPRQVCDAAPKRAHPEDILLSVRAPVGALNIADQAYGIGRGLCAIKPGSVLDVQFCFYLLTRTRARLDAVATGSTYDAVTASEVGALPALLPPLPEQCAIAAFLDRETAKIDALVAKKERLIELLLEKRSALITCAIIKGLDPNVLMKDSGVEWLGKIPAHWEVCHLRRVISQFVDYRGQTPEKAASGIPLITARNLKDQTIDFSLSEEYIPGDLYDSWMVRGLPEQGDVLVTTEAPLGESAEIQDPSIALAQRIILLKADKKRITNEYLKYHFASNSGKSELRSRATGSTAVGIKASHLKATMITLPTLEEQKKIGSFIDTHTTNLDALVSKIREGIEGLKEYRTALIWAAVTGRIDVREQVA